MTQRATFLAIACVLLILPAAANADYLGGIRYSQHNPGSLPNNLDVEVTIDYKVTEAEGGVIFARPYTNGATTPNYAASGGDIVPMGTGTVMQSFRIVTGEHTVDHVRVYLKSPDLTQTWLEVFLPVSFEYGPSAVFDMDFSRTRYSILKYGQQFSVTFNYQAADPLGCRVYVRPYTNGAPTPGYSASGSALLPQAGTTTQWFSFVGDADVTHLHYTINDHNGTPIFARDIPYPLHWRSVGVYNIGFSSPVESCLHNTQIVTTAFTLDHDVAEGVRVWTWPTIGGADAPYFACQPSALEAIGAHVVSRYCRITQGEQDVDGIRIHMEVGNTTILDYIVPVDYHWAPHAIQNPVFTPAAPAILSNGEFLGATVDYLTSATGNVRIYALPALDYELVPGSPTYSTSIYPAPSGSASCFCTFNSGDHVGDSMRFRMATSDWSQVLLTHYYHGHFAWGNSAVITPVPEAGVVAAAQLGATYPNPFNPAANIPIELTADATVRVAVFDLRGRLVQTLVDGSLPAGHHEIRFDGTNLASGTYVCRLDGPSGVQTRRMTLVK